MKLVYETIEKRFDASFKINSYALPVFDCPYHFHPEVELTLIENSVGTRLIGSQMSRFGPGDLVLIGSNVPHWYYNNPTESEGRNWARSVVVQFRPDFLGETFLHSPEIRPIAHLLERARRGLAITGKLREGLSDRVRDLQHLKGCASLLELIHILNTIAEARNGLKELGEEEVFGTFSNHDGSRLDKVFRYIQKHFNEEVRLETVAAVAGMTASSFSRFFRAKVGRTFQMAVIQARIMEACQQLMATDATITEICYACGFNNLSNFNRRFKLVTGVTPKMFRQQWRGGVPQDRDSKLQLPLPATGRRPFQGKGHAGEQS